jgi:hypothetical protein
MTGLGVHPYRKWTGARPGSTYSTSTPAHSVGPPARAASSVVIRVTLRRDKPLDNLT